MKYSKYNIRIPEHNMVILYNSFTNEYVAISPKADQVLTNIGWETKLKEQFPKHYAQLIEKGFIISDERDELAEIRLQNKREAFSSRSLYMMVYPTQDCNLKCWYCYESHVKDSLMSEEVQERILKMLEERLKNNSFDSLRLAFFGGEPLIGFNVVALPLSRKIKALLDKYDKTFQTFFVTNATLLTSDVIKCMKEIHPYFQITLDGCREKHNNVRVRKQGVQGTYDEIMSAIKSVVSDIYSLKEYNDPIVTLRINYDNNTLKHVGEIIADLGDIDRRAVYVHLERVWQTKDRVDEEQRQLLKEAIFQFIEAGFYIGQGCFGEKRVSCPAESDNYLIVNYDGNIFRCNGRTLTEETKEGILEPDGKIIWDKTLQAKRIGLSTFENHRCLNCKMLPRCMGPCSQKLMEHGEINDSICTLETLDVPLEEYLKLDFQMKFLLDSQNKE